MKKISFLSWVFIFSSLAWLIELLIKWIKGGAGPETYIPIRKISLKKVLSPTPNPDDQDDDLMSNTMAVIIVWMDSLVTYDQQTVKIKFKTAPHVPLKKVIKETNFSFYTSNLPTYNPPLGSGGPMSYYSHPITLPSRPRRYNNVTVPLTAIGRTSNYQPVKSDTIEVEPD